MGTTWLVDHVRKDVLSFDIRQQRQLIKMVSSGHELVSYGGPSSAGSANLPSETTTQPGSDNITPSGDAMLHPSGDLLIYHNEFTIPLLLCSKAFALLCKPWAKMVEYRMVMGSEESKEDERMKIDLSDDDPIALSILLYISHLRFEMVPSFLSLKQLFALSVLTDKYEATRMVRPWIAHWLSIWNIASMETKVANVWIAWEFGLLEDFERIATALVLDAEIKDDSDSLFYNSKELPGEVPPGLIGMRVLFSVKKARDLTQYRKRPRSQAKGYWPTARHCLRLSRPVPPSSTTGVHLNIHYGAVPLGVLSNLCWHARMPCLNVRITAPRTAGNRPVHSA